MLVAIISDVHNNEVNLKKVLDYCKKNSVEEIICCGDLASKDTLDFLCTNFSGPIYYAFGNMDSGQLRELEGVDKYKNAQIFRDFGEAKINKISEKSKDLGTSKIAFTHYPVTAKELAQTEKYDFVFYGHTHKPWTEKIGNTTLLNPGNVAGEIYPPTFATWDTQEDEFKLIRIHELE